MDILEEAQTNDICPCCGNSDHEGMGFEFEGEYVESHWQCNSCNTKFTQTFNLMGCVITKDKE